MNVDYYVYVLYRRDRNTPFYIGKGRGKRWLRHEQSAVAGRSRKDNIIVAMKRDGIVPIPKEKLATDLTNEQAKQLERDLIRLLLRVPGGPLVNRTMGGDGSGDFVLPPHVRQKISQTLMGHPVSEETRRKFSEARRGKPIPQATRDAVSRAHRGKTVSAETRKKLKIASTGRRHTPEAKHKMSAANIGRKLSPERRAQIAIDLTGRPVSAESRAKMSASRKRMLRGRKAIHDLFDWGEPPHDRTAREAITATQLVPDDRGR